jgi:drug/metabolite transporter (DMT)-like permease
MEMLAGGLALAIAGAALGEWSSIDPATFSIRSLAAVGYLVVFGSVVAFTAYMWLLRVSTPARVATYAYVNPIVAVFLGWWLVGEQVTARTLVAAVVILLGVAVIITFGRSYRSHGDPGAAGPVRVAVASSETSRRRS